MRSGAQAGGVAIVGLLAIAAPRDALAQLAGQPPPGTYVAPSAAAPATAPPPAPAGTYVAPAAQPSPTALDPSMQAGGLAPPPPMATSATPAPAPTPSATERQLEEAKAKDSGRGLSWFWLDLHGGFQHVGVRTFSSNNFIEGAPTSANGAFIAPGLGARLLFLTVGARGHFGFFNSWDVFTVGGEIGMRAQKGNFEPHLDVGGGYAALGNFKVDPADVQHLNGFYLRIGGGLDYFVTPVVSVGGNLSFELLHFGEPTVPSVATGPVGSSNGLAVSVAGGVGLHF